MKLNRRQLRQLISEVMILEMGGPSSLEFMGQSYRVPNHLKGGSESVIGPVVEALDKIGEALEVMNQYEVSIHFTDPSTSKHIVKKNHSGVVNARVLFEILVSDPGPHEAGGTHSGLTMKFSPKQIGHSIPKNVSKSIVRFLTSKVPDFYYEEDPRGFYSGIYVIDTRRPPGM